MSAPKGNTYALGNSGLNKRFESNDKLQEAIDGYFASCKADNSPCTIEGLCDALGVTRQTLLNYEKRDGYEVYFDTIKRAKTKILRNLTERALNGDNVASVAIFLLKNNYGYKDKIEHTGENGNPLLSQLEIVVVRNKKDVENERKNASD